MQNLDFLVSIARNIFSKRMNRSRIGFSISRKQDLIRLDDIRNYASAIRENSLEQVEGRTVAPPFFITKLVFPMIKKIILDPDLNLNVIRMVHGEMCMEWDECILENDSLEVGMHISDIRDTPAGELLEIKGEVFRSERKIATASAGMIVRGKGSRRRKKKARKEDASPLVLKEAYRFDIQTFEGQEMEYAESSGDRNLIHTNRFFARLAGLPSTILHGLCVMSMTASGLAGKIADGKINRLRRISGRFSGFVIAGQKLTVVVYESDVEGNTPYTVLNPKGRPVIKNGYISFR